MVRTWHSHMFCTDHIYKRCVSFPFFPKIINDSYNTHWIFTDEDTLYILDVFASSQTKSPAFPTASKEKLFDQSQWWSFSIILKYPNIISQTYILHTYSRMNITHEFGLLNVTERLAWWTRIYISSH